LARLWNSVGVDLSAPLASLIPSLDAAVLEVLAGTESALGASQIQRLARRGARSGVRRVLDRLTEHGLILAEPTNLGYVYRLNRDHLLAPAVHVAATARSEFLRRLAASCEELRPQVISAALFGSTARRQSTPMSDIDLVLIVENGSEAAEDPAEVWDQQIRDLEDAVLAWTGNRLECLILSESQLGHAVVSEEKIVEAWLHEALPLAGTALPTVISGVRDGLQKESP